ncbi:FAD:protein FMN transferase [Asticcacaulis sp. MM231]|uniref:FAD:protein FMN transferase n=1 Tax=Asticcacaulis sp. MM231 TaxID=3157666 RepID=UPI0032D5AB0B
MTPPAYTLDRHVLIPDLDEAPDLYPQARRMDLKGKAFATTWSIALYADTATEGLDVRCQAVLDRIDKEMSPYRIDSDLTRFNLAPAGTFVNLPDSLRTVVGHALEIAALSAGAFDPALLSAVELWGFGARVVAEGLPEASDVSALRGQKHGWCDLVVQGGGMVKPAEVRLDLCAIAKGFAVDELMRLLQVEPGVRAALVEIGGELKGWGVQPDGLPWWVEIEAPEAAKEPRTVAALCGWAVATSGERVRSFVHEGQVHSHTIDSVTQSPTRSDIVSVTVFDPQCWRADALATALMVMGEERAIEFTRQHEIPCLLWVRAETLHNGLRAVRSPRLEGWL